MDDYDTDTLFDTDPEADDNALSAPDEDASDDEGSGIDRESNREGSDTEEVKFLRRQRQCSLVVSLMKQSISLQEDDVPEVKRRRNCAHSAQSPDRRRKWRSVLPVCFIVSAHASFMLLY
jgi:hypothetical protein